MKKKENTTQLIVYNVKGTVWLREEFGNCVEKAKASV